MCCTVIYSERINVMILPENLTTIYVSQKNGNDLETGFLPVSDERKNGPLKTVEKAVEYVKQMRFFGHLQPVTIKVLDEEYSITKPIVIDCLSGYHVPDGAFNVTIEPYTKTLISGGMKITGFSDDTLNGVKCFSKEIPEIKDGLWFTDFYVDGKRADFTHFPETGKLTPLSVDDNNTALLTHSKWFIARPEDLERIKDFDNFEDCFISYNHYWVDEHTPIESYDVSTGKIVCKYVSRFSVSSLYPRSSLEYIIENVKECFKNPNEWYLDRKEAKVYYIPRDKSQKAENIVAYAPLCDKILEIRGSAETAIKNITVRGFDMAYTKGDYQSFDGWEQGAPPDENGNAVAFASDPQSVCSAHGSIEMEFAQYCGMENCNLFCLGVHGIYLKHGCCHNRITDNDIADIGAGGISAVGGGYGCDESVINAYNTYSGNVIRHIGRRYYSACGILIRNSKGNLISHNDISDLFYSGISVGWEWGYADSSTNNNIIEYNHIHNVGQGFLSDMGGVYLLGKQSGTIVRNNLIHDVESKHYGGWGIYTDEGSSYITIENNICYNISCNAYHQHYGSMNTIRNNIFVKSKEIPITLTRNEMRTGLIFERNILVTDGSPIYKVGYEYCDSGSVHSIAAHENLIFDLQKENPTVIKVADTEYNLTEAQNAFGLEEGTLSADPCFSDYENNDFSLKDHSPAYHIGFKPIDVQNIGVLRKRR